jgi:hypothetical protein
MLKVLLLVSVLAADGTFPAPDRAKAPSFRSIDACYEARMVVYRDAMKRKVSLVAKCEVV